MSYNPGASSSRISTSSDVTLAGLIDGQVLAYDSVQSKWVNANFIANWTASRPYRQGQLVINPSGQVVSALANFTANASYNSSNWSAPVNTQSPLGATQLISRSAAEGLPSTTGLIEGAIAIVSRT